MTQEFVLRDERYLPTPEVSREASTGRKRGSSRRSGSCAGSRHEAAYPDDVDVRVIGRPDERHAGFVGDVVDDGEFSLEFPPPNPAVLVTPVMLPPGRAMLATSPRTIGSPIIVTIGIVAVAIEV